MLKLRYARISYHNYSNIERLGEKMYRGKTSTYSLQRLDCNKHFLVPVTTSWFPLLATAFRIKYIEMKCTKNNNMSLFMGDLITYLLSGGVFSNPGLKLDKIY